MEKGVMEGVGLNVEEGLGGSRGRLREGREEVR